MDSSYLRYFHFYNQTGMRPTEPFIGELVGDWYLINGEDRKNGIPMQMQLNEELKSMDWLDWCRFLSGLRGLTKRHRLTDKQYENVT